MTNLYVDLQNIATDLLTEFQQGSVVLIKQVPGSGPVYDPGPPTPREVPLRAAVKGVTSKFQNGKVLLASDLEVVCAVPASSADWPEENLDRGVMIDGLIYSIISFSKLPAAGTPVAFKMIVRR